MVFEVVFDIQATGYKAWWFPFLGIPFLLLAAIYYAIIYYFMKRSLSFYERLWTISYSGIAVSFILITFVSTYGEYVWLVDSYSSGSYEVVEGYIKDFEPKLEVGDGESFVVGENFFTYNDQHISSAYNTTTLVGGELSEGDYVRIYHVAGSIVKLEIKRDIK